jgi:hypothetical protein
MVWWVLVSAGLSIGSSSQGELSRYHGARAMSTDKLFAALHFTGLAIGGSASLAHGLKLSGRALVPDLIIPQYPGSFEVTASTTSTITLHNTADTTGDCIVWCQVIHPVMRMFGMPLDDGTLDEFLTPHPFVLGSPNSGTPSGGGGLTISAILTTGTVLTDANQLVRVNPTAGGFTVTLPAASAASGKVVVMKNVSASTNAVVVAAGAGDTMDGAAQVTLVGNRFHWQAVSDGVSQWMVTA